MDIVTTLGFFVIGWIVGTLVFHSVANTVMRR